MATLKFYLADKGAEKTNIYFFLNYGAYEFKNGKKKYLPFKYFINEAIEPKNWNSELGRVKQTKSFRQFPEFNARLQAIEDEALTILRKLQNDNIKVTHELLRSKLDNIFKAEKIGKNKTTEKVTDSIDYYLTTKIANKHTAKTFVTVKRNLLDYESDYKICLTFDKITIDFNTNFIHWLKHKYRLAPNTIGARIKTIKTVMRDAYERGLHTNTDFSKKAFVKPKEETKAVYLNDLELMKMLYLDLSDDKKLGNVRDWFLIAAYSGLRFSDFSRLTKDNIKDGNITIKTQKTGAEVVIPLHSVVVSILEKHDYNLPKVINNLKFNEYLKDVCRMAKINEIIIIDETKGDLKYSKSVPKHNLIGAHTARRSFATNAYKAGVPVLQIMKLTGHKTETEFLKYIRISEQENADILRGHPFFKIEQKK